MVVGGGGSRVRVAADAACHAPGIDVRIVACGHMLDNAVPVVPVPVLGVCTVGRPAPVCVCLCVCVCVPPQGYYDALHTPGTGSKSHVKAVACAQRRLAKVCVAWPRWCWYPPPRLTCGSRSRSLPACSPRHPPRPVFSPWYTTWRRIKRWVLPCAAAFLVVARGTHWQAAPPPPHPTLCGALPPLPRRRRLFCLSTTVKAIAEASDGHGRLTRSAGGAAVLGSRVCLLPPWREPSIARPWFWVPCLPCNAGEGAAAPGAPPAVTFVIRSATPAPPPHPVPVPAPAVPWTRSCSTCAQIPPPSWSLEEDTWASEQPAAPNALRCCRWATAVAPARRLPPLVGGAGVVCVCVCVCVGGGVQRGHAVVPGPLCPALDQPLRAFKLPPWCFRPALCSHCAEAPTASVKASSRGAGGRSEPSVAAAAACQRPPPAPRATWGPGLCRGLEAVSRGGGAGARRGCQGCCGQGHWQGAAAPAGACDSKPEGRASASAAVAIAARVHAVSFFQDMLHSLHPHEPLLATRVSVSQMCEAHEPVRGAPPAPAGCGVDAPCGVRVSAARCAWPTAGGPARSVRQRLPAPGPPAPLPRGPPPPRRAGIVSGSDRNAAVNIELVFLALVEGRPRPAHLRRPGGSSASSQHRSGCHGDAGSSSDAPAQPAGAAADAEPAVTVGPSATAGTLPSAPAALAAAPSEPSSAVRRPGRHGRGHLAAGGPGPLPEAPAAAPPGPHAPHVVPHHDASQAPLPCRRGHDAPAGAPHPGGPPPHPALNPDLPSRPQPRVQVRVSPHPGTSRHGHPLGGTGVRAPAGRLGLVTGGGISSPWRASAACCRCAVMMQGPRLRQPPPTVLPPLY